MLLVRTTLVVLVVAVAAACGGTSQPKRVVSNSLVLIDRDDDSITDVVRLRGAPTRVTYGAGAFWVTVPRPGAVVRIDADSHRVTRFEVGDEPYDVAVGGGAVWIADHDAQRLFRLDPGTRRVRPCEPLGAPVVAVGYGLGAVWAVAAPGHLNRFDPHTLKITRTTTNVAFTSEGAEPKLLFEPDDLLVASPASAAITRIAPDGAVEQKRDLNGLAGATLRGRDVWVTSSSGAVGTLDGRVRTRVGLTPRDVVVAGDSVWVADFGTQTLKRVATRDGKVAATIRLRKLPVSLAAGDGLVAVAVTD